VKPPTGTESEEMRRTRFGAAAVGAAAPVVICDDEGIGCPQDKQNRLPAGISAEQNEHCIAEDGMATGRLQEVESLLNFRASAQANPANPN
jgi:hypothetical protein